MLVWLATPRASQPHRQEPGPPLCRLRPLARWPAASHCRYFAWLDGAEASSAGTSSPNPREQPASSSHAAPQAAGPAGPPTPEREAGPWASRLAPAPTAGAGAATAADAAAGTGVPARPSQAAVVSSPGSAGASRGVEEAAAACEGYAVLLLVVGANAPPQAPQLLPPAPQGLVEERVQLVLLPASSHPPALCTQHLAEHRGPHRLPQAPASLLSLQPPFVTLRHCPAARGLAEAVGWTPPDGSSSSGSTGRAGGAGGLFVLDCETTGLSGRDYIHQLSVLNIATCQQLTALLRTCPCTSGPQAAQACGCTDLAAWNAALHDPSRPTFGQLWPLLHAFMTAGDGGSPCSSHGSSNGSTGSSNITTGSAPAGSSTSGSSSSSSRASSAGPGPVVVAHNGVFDARMLIGEWTRRGLPVPQHWRLLDTLPLAKGWVAGCPNNRQGSLRLHIGVELAPGEAEHEASADVAVLAQLLPHLIRASGAGGAAAILEGRLRRKTGASYVTTFGGVQARVSGGTGDAADAAADTAVFTCPFCQARVVQ